MVRMLLLAALASGVVAIPGRATDQPAEETKNKADVHKLRPSWNAITTQQEEDQKPGLTAQKIVHTLHNTRVAPYEKDLQTTPLPEVLGDLAKRYELTFVIDKTVFDEPAALNDAKADRLMATRLDGLSLHAFLNIYFRGLNVPNVTYLVRDDRIEITSRQAAQKEAGLFEAIEEAKATEDRSTLVRAKARLDLPLVSVVVEEKPISTVLRDLSRVYGLNVVIHPGAREVTKALVTQRLLNVPADTAIEQLVRQTDMSVVRKGNVFLVGFSEGA